MKGHSVNIAQTVHLVFWYLRKLFKIARILTGTFTSLSRSSREGSEYVLMEQQGVYQLLVPNVELKMLLTAGHWKFFYHISWIPSTALMVSEYSDLTTHLCIQNSSLQLMTSYIFSGNRTCGQSLICQTSHWAKVLFPAKGCNLSHLARVASANNWLALRLISLADSKSARAPAGALKLSGTSHTPLYT